MSSQKNSPCVQFRHQVARHFAATNLFVSTGLIMCDFLQRQNSVAETRFSEKFWNKQKVICPRNITYCHNMLLHLVTKCSNLLHLSTEKWGVLKFSFDVVNTCSSHFTDFFGSFAWHIPFHLVHQQSSVWQYKRGSWSLSPLLFQNCHLWLWLKEQGSWLCMMHC